MTQYTSNTRLLKMMYYQTTTLLNILSIVSLIPKLWVFLLFVLLLLLVTGFIIVLVVYPTFLDTHRRSDFRRNDH